MLQEVTVWAVASARLGHRIEGTIDRMRNYGKQPQNLLLSA